jgi:hypothetical protein
MSNENIVNVRLRFIFSTMKVSGYETDNKLISNLEWFYRNLHVHNRRHKDYIEAIDIIEMMLNEAINKHKDLHKKLIIPVVVQQLKEHYERKASDLDSLITKDFTLKGRKLVRLIIYRSLYRQFSHELGGLDQES